MKSKRLIFVVVVVTIAAFYTGSLVYINSLKSNTEARIARCKVEMTALKAASAQYEATYGTRLTSENATALKVLFGSNPQRRAFLDVNPKSISRTGEWLDPWRMPYQIKAVSTNGVAVRSAGPNKTFGDEDDIITEETAFSPPSVSPNH